MVFGAICCQGNAVYVQMLQGAYWTELCVKIRGVWFMFMLHLADFYFIQASEIIFFLPSYKKQKQALLCLVLQYL